MLNFSVALAAGGILKLVLDFKSVISSVLLIVAGVYLAGATIIAAKNAENKE